MKKTFKILGHTIREFVRKIKDDKTNKYKAKFLAIVTVIMIGLLFGVNLILRSYARFETKVKLNAKTSVALFILEPGNYEFQMGLDGIVPQNQDYLYEFDIMNFKDSDTSEVDMEYDMKVITTTNLPVTYKLYKNQSPTNGTNILTNKNTEQDSDKSWYNVFNLGKISTFTKETQTTDKYYLTVNYPEEYKNNQEYAGKIDSIVVKINARQVI